MKLVDLDGYIGYAFYGRGEDYVCAMGHVDVVPAGEGWKEPPFNGHIGKRSTYTAGGVLDNKGPVMACLYGLAAVRALGLPLRHPVRIIFGCDEETGLRISDTICQKKSLLFTDLRRTANILWYTVSGEGQLCASPAQGNTWVHFSTL